jgi:thermitase
MHAHLFSMLMAVLLFANGLLPVAATQLIGSKFDTMTDSESRSFLEDTRLLSEMPWGSKNDAFGYSSSPVELSSVRSDNESVELIIGVNSPDLRLQDLRNEIRNDGGEVTGGISADGSVRALTVKVPIDRAYSFAGRLRADDSVKYVVPNTRVEAYFTPNDQYWPQQWGPKKIEADKAWDTTFGSSSILVAIIDTGIDYTHPDLSPNYVPLGYDWVNNDTDPMDDNNHGTHCAGIVAAALNNNIGIAGLAQVKIMAEKVLDANGWGYDSWVTQGIYHAVASGAKIVSMSLGGSEDSAPLHEAVKYASDHGVLVIAAAGNTANDARQYPAAYEEAIAVSATDSLDNLASFSTYGDWVDLSAPGVDIYSTIRSGSYAYLSGTSMACPHVTGVAALAWSVWPNYTMNQIRSLLLRSAEDLGEGGFDPYFGYGRVNARRAVAGLPEHDVAVSTWKHPSRANPGEVVTFIADVSNYGTNNETNVTVRFVINGTVVNSTTIASLQVDACSEVSFQWSTTIISVYNATCYAEPVPGENITENNAISSEVLVRFVTTFRVPQDFLTIKLAISNVGDGDTILVAEGCYAEGQIDVFRNNVTLIADGTATLDGQSGSCVLNVQASYVTIEGFDIRNCSGWGVKITGSNDFFRENLIHCANGLWLGYSSNCLLEYNYVEANTAYSSDWWEKQSITLEYSSNNTVRQNRVVSNVGLGGINLMSSSNNTIVENSVTGGVWFGGLLLSYSEWNLVASNYITGNRVGLVLTSSPNNTLRNNKMVNNWCNFAPWRTESREGWWNGPSDVDASNTVNGRPICYWVNVSNTTVPSNVGCVVLVGCKNIKVEGLELRDNYNGIFMANSSDILIRRNHLTHNFCNYEPLSGGILAWKDTFNITVVSNDVTANDSGMKLWGENNTVAQNNIADNHEDGVDVADNSAVNGNNITGNVKAGVYVSGSNCTVSSNNITANIGVGISVSGSGHMISSNTIIGYGKPSEGIIGANRDGIFLGPAQNCTIHSNNIIRCLDYGIDLYMASDNLIYNNNLVDNTQQFRNLGDSSNSWDNGYPTGGNYWSNWVGPDFYSGPYQNESGSDGIRDIPVTLDGSNLDRFPLMQPISENPPPQLYWLTITGQVNSEPVSGFYNTPWPPPGTYVFLANYIVGVDTQLKALNPAYVDCWKLDGTNISSEDYATLVMNKNHTLHSILYLTSPSVNIAPLTASVPVGDSMVFTSSVSNAKPPYEYQWCLNGIEVWNATSPTWIFTPKKIRNYTVQLKIQYPFFYTYSSNNVTIAVVPFPEVSISPSYAALLVGQSVEFTSTILDVYPPYSYQWYLNEEPVPGATKATWVFTPDEIGDYTIYLNVKDNAGRSLGSNRTTVTVLHQLIVSISPMHAFTSVGQPIEFTSTTSGGFPPYSYQWYLDKEAVAGANSSIWSFVPTTTGIYYISLQVTDCKGNTNQTVIAQAIVQSVSVGGYSIGMKKPPPVKLDFSITLLMTVAAGFAFAARKIHRKRTVPSISSEDSILSIKHCTASRSTLLRSALWPYAPNCLFFTTTTTILCADVRALISFLTGGKEWSRGNLRKFVTRRECKSHPARHCVKEG